MATLKERVFESLNNAKANGVDWTHAEPDKVTDDLCEYDADIGKYIFEADSNSDEEDRQIEIDGYVKEWQLKQEPKLR